MVLAALPPTATTGTTRGFPGFAALRLVLLLPVLLLARAACRRRLDPARIWRPTDALFTRDATLDLTVVIPCYNPGEHLRPTVLRLLECADRAGLAYEVIAVSDGSTDGSESTVEGLAPQVRVVRLPQNRGKGAALHRGFAQAQGRYVGFVDADGDIDPAHVVAYYQQATAQGQDVVYASKRHQASRSQSSLVRKLISATFIGFVWCLFALGVHDTQTGCKVIRRDVLVAVLPRLREQRFAFDLEFFVAARAAGVRRMAAAPVEIRVRMAGSSVGRAAITRTLADTLAVLGRLHFTPIYRNGTGVPVPRQAVETLQLSKAA